MNGQDKIHVIKDLIADGEIGEALTAFRALTKDTRHENEVLLQANRFNGLREQRRLKTISQENYELERNNIGFALLELLTTIQHPKSSIQQPASSIPTPYTSKLPSTTPHLFGREKELALLDEAWDNRSCKLLQFIAWGGVGKTGLVTSWLLGRMNEGNLDDVAVYAWSFYSQGASDQRQSSADLFIVDILKWFGEDETKLPNSPHDRGRLLAEHLRRQRTLLILDGLEPLQYPPGELEGQLKDQGLRVLLREIAANQPGLCIITSRIAVKDVEQYLGKAARLVPLEQLSDTAGAELLASLGVKGLPKELEAASAEFKGHALALRLLGNYLAAVHKGDVRRRDKIANRLELSEKDGRHARRVMDAYIHWLGADSPEMALLLLIGLFDRPAPIGALEVVIGRKEVKKYTNLWGLLKRNEFINFGILSLSNTFKLKSLINLRQLSSEKQAYTLDHLVRLSLLSKNESHETDRKHLIVHTSLYGSDGINSIDAHPLVREHFGELFKNLYPHAWQQCNAALYAYYKALPEKECPDTLEEMEPLFAAVTHGCKAGFYQAVFDELYFKRINREREYYLTTKIGALGTDITLLFWFFEEPWKRPIQQLFENSRIEVLGNTASRLRAIGRAEEGITPLKIALEMAIKKKQWQNASLITSDLSEIYLLLGLVKLAIDEGEQSIQYANELALNNNTIKGNYYSPNSMHKIIGGPTLEILSEEDKSADPENFPPEFSIENIYTTYAYLLFQINSQKEAANYFEKAEKLQRARLSGHKYLYGVNSFQYCDFLLSTKKKTIAAVIERAFQGMNISKKMKWLLDIALDHLTLGKAYHLLSITDPTDTNVEGAAQHLEAAVTGLRKAGSQDDLPLGLLARAAWHRQCGAYEAAATDLAEVEEIASAGGMRLHLCDYHLEMARLQWAMGEVEAAKVHTELAARMVEEMGYRRRDGEVMALREGLAALK